MAGADSGRGCIGTGAMGNAIISRGNVPVVKTGVIMTNAARNAIASVSNGFALRKMGGNSGLAVSCVKCVRRSLIIGRGSRCGVILGRSSRDLSRIMIINCNARGGMGLANTITTVNTSRVVRTPMTGVSGTLTNHLPNVHMRGANNAPNTRSDISVHKFKGPLVLMSKIRRPNFRMSPGRVRDVSMLGSTSTTVCKIGTNGNIMLVAAGGNTRKGTRVACGKSVN